MQGFGENKSELNEEIIELLDQWRAIEGKIRAGGTNTVVKNNAKKIKKKKES